MLNTRLKMIQEHAAQANKAAFEVEKARDELHNQIEQIEQRLHPKRAHSHDDVVMLMKCSQKLIIGT
jgi:hypothetical protein